MQDPAAIRPTTASDNIDFNKLKIVVRTNWYWIVLIFLTINAVAALYIRYTKNLYESESILKLDIKKDALDLGITNIAEDQNLNHLSGEIEIIKSKLFLNRVLDEVDFEARFFSVGRLLNEELYRSSAPAVVTYYSKSHSLYNTRIGFRETSPESFELSIDDQEKVRGSYNKLVRIRDLDLILARNDAFRSGDEIGYFLMIRSRDVLLTDLSRSLTAEPLNFNANTVRVSFRDYNPFQAKYVLSKIDTIYLQYSNEQKNQANKQKIEWIGRELSNIEKRMEDFEDYFENFTLANKTHNLDEDLRRTIEALNQIDSQRYEYSRRIKEVDVLIANLRAGERFPPAIRVQLPERVIQQIDALSELEKEQERLKLSYKEVTFAYRQKEQDISALRTRTLLQLADLRKGWEDELTTLNQHKTNLEKQFASLPDKSTEFSKNQRFYKLYEEFYLTLMQSKSEFEIAQAGSTPDFKILSPASLPSVPISPNNAMIIGTGLVASLVVIFFFVSISYLINNKITSLYELEKLPSTPVLGAVPMSTYLNGAGLHTVQHPKSMLSESIRTLRTNLDFFNVASTRKVIAISSTISGEGKSFIAMNLGSVMAMSDKKVILIDLDMRKAKGSTPFKSTDDSRGVSTILIGKSTWRESLISTAVENFDYLPAGPHPPNPSELLLNTQFVKMLNELKEHYDVIILDTPPVGLVTDGIMAMKNADISLYVFRANYSRKEFIHNLQRIININKFDNITTILNAVPTPGKAYGYGYYENNGKSVNLKSIFR